ncbi:MAG: Asp-tRNA(Asn)/Glu-tRNA(Gln) amidotransferase subunit GatC [Campylobacterota bacterium]|nr:Asp-tRNA(Asn)/Glu-tRNA(Gln) amidotransferase subunit GatC [Campylobacterota bacterium]
MQVDEALLSRLEKLSYIKISDDKREEVIGQLAEFLEFADNLSSLDTSGVDETFAMTTDGTQLREDKPLCSSEIGDEIMKHSPRSDEHFFIVPKIIE